MHPCYNEGTQFLLKHCAMYIIFILLKNVTFLPLHIRCVLAERGCSIFYGSFFFFFPVVNKLFLGRGIEHLFSQLQTWCFCTVRAVL